MDDNLRSQLHELGLQGELSRRIGLTPLRHIYRAAFRRLRRWRPEPRTPPPLSCLNDSLLEHIAAMLPSAHDVCALSACCRNFSRCMVDAAGAWESLADREGIVGLQVQWPSTPGARARRARVALQLSGRWRRGPIEMRGILRGHNHWVVSLATCEPSNWVVSGSDDGSIRLWNPASGKCYSVMKEVHCMPVVALAAQPASNSAPSLGRASTAVDGTWIASSSGEPLIHLWHLRDGEPPSPTGYALASSSPSVRPATMSLTGSLVAHTDTVWALSWLPGGLLASASDDRTIRLWDAAAVVASPHDRTPSVSSRSSRQPQDDEDGTPHPPPHGLPSSTCDAPEQQHRGSGNGIAPGSRQGAAHPYSRASEQSRATPSTPTSPTALLAETLPTDAGAHFPTLQGACREPLCVLRGHSQGIVAMVTWHENVLASGSYDNTVRLWDAAALVGAVIRQRGRYRDAVGSVYNPQSLPTPECYATLTGHEAWVSSLAPLGSRLASGSYDGTVRVWSPAPPGPSGTAVQKVGVLVLHQGQPVTTLCAVGGSLLAAGGYDHCVHIWCPRTATKLHTLRGHHETVWALASASPLCASGAADNVVRLWGPPGVEVNAPFDSDVLGAASSASPTRRELRQRAGSASSPPRSRAALTHGAHARASEPMLHAPSPLHVGIILRYLRSCSFGVALAQLASWLLASPEPRPSPIHIRIAATNTVRGL